GLGLSSCLFFTWIAIFAGRHDGFVRSEVTFVILLGLCAVFVRRRRTAGSIVPRDTPRNADPAWIVTAGFLIALAVAGIAFARLSIAAPHGSFDAWGI